MSTPHWSTEPSDLLRVGAEFDLSTIDPVSTPGIKADKKSGAALLAAGATELNDLQEKLWAESRFGGTRSLLLVLQAMDTAGKGGIVEHVMGGISPEGIHSYAFKKPTPEELSHEFLWRVRKQVPSAGMVGVFDRSHYEDVLIGRVRSLATPEAIDERYGLIRDFEAEVAASGTAIVKVMLHISSDEQKARLQARLDDPTKHWKYNPGDLDERALWPQYQEAYQLALEKTSTVDAPWFVVPANHKWYARLAVQRIVLETLTAMKLGWPAVDYDLEAERAKLAAS